MAWSSLLHPYCSHLPQYQQGPTQVFKFELNLLLPTLPSVGSGSALVCTTLVCQDLETHCLQQWSTAALVLGMSLSCDFLCESTGVSSCLFRDTAILKLQSFHVSLVETNSSIMLPSTLHVPGCDLFSQVVWASERIDTGNMRSGSLLSEGNMQPPWSQTYP